jgi:hypothetical protein
VPQTTITHGTKNPRSVRVPGQSQHRCRQCGFLRPRSYFLPSKPHTSCSWCRRYRFAVTRGQLGEAALLWRYRDLDAHIAVGLGPGWPRKLLWSATINSPMQELNVRA